MPRFLIPLASLALLGLVAGPARAELDLTPRRLLTGGGLVERIYFADGNTKFAVTLDGETKVTPAEGGALFRFTTFSQASMRLGKTPLEKHPPFDEASLPDYTKAAAALLPASAEKPELLWQGPGALPVNHWQTYRFLYRYHVAGLLYRESITFLTLESGQQIVIHTGAQSKDFDVIAARADDMIRRWHEVLPGDDQGAN